ncbi:hypothetical protein [Oharaeibacter diazotrophicus]|nr:hypothetical protein [Oharaeibacter diazotrophicus]
MPALGANSGSSPWRDDVGVAAGGGVVDFVSEGDMADLLHGQGA